MKKNFNYNRWLYGAFVIFGFYFAFVNKDYVDASINLGIALAFDPFQQEVEWNK